MKKALLLIALFTGAQLHAQSVSEFLQNKLYIVQSDLPTPNFDTALNQLIRRVWNLSPVAGPMSGEEFKNTKTSTGYSFISPTINLTEIISREGPRMSSRGFIAPGLEFYVGGKKGNRVVKTVYFGGMYQEDYDNCIYRLELMIRNAMSGLTHDGSMDSVSNTYNMGLLKEKTLLINKKYLEKPESPMNFPTIMSTPLFTMETLAEYPYKVEYATEAQISSYISEKNKNYVLAVPLIYNIPGYSHELVILYDVETGFEIGGCGGKINMEYHVRKGAIKKMVSDIEKGKKPKRND